MNFLANDMPSGLARWTSRLAFFSVGLLAVVAVLHRAFGMPTPVAFVAAGIAYLGSLAAVLMAAAAAVHIWRSGGAGASRVVAGLVLGLPVVLLPALLAIAARDTAPLNDVTTDPANPPQFSELAALRSTAENPAKYPGGRTADLQKRAYPDLQPLLINRPAVESYDLVLDVLKRLRYDVVTEPPQPSDDVAALAPGGVIEAIDRTLVLGFYDDIAVRVTGNEVQSRIDLRSASRYGRIDFGRNAERLREMLKEIVIRLEATVPAAGSEPAGKLANKKSLKRPKDADPSSEDLRKSRDRARTSSRRAQERKEPPP